MSSEDEEECEHLRDVRFYLSLAKKYVDDAVAFYRLRKEKPLTRHHSILILAGELQESVDELIEPLADLPAAVRNQLEFLSPQSAQNIFPHVTDDVLHAHNVIEDDTRTPYGSFDRCLPDFADMSVVEEGEGAVRDGDVAVVEAPHESE